MDAQTSIADPFVILYGIPWETYGRILDALGGYHLRHTYDQGTLEMRGLLYGVDWQDYRKLPAFAAMQVPEVWRYDGKRLHFCRLGTAREYAATSASAAFPFITPADVTRHLDQRHSVDENTLIRSFIEWAREQASH